MAENNSNTNEAELRKGPWSREEDNMLIEYVGRHGEGNWSAVQRNSGLLRGGQSYRLRWLNHLKPGLKKGAISAEEKRQIVKFHAMFGNRWAKIAAELPGRTDNEIKNFWKCRERRLERAGLPLYPPEVLARAEAYHQQTIQICFPLFFAYGFPVSAYWSPAPVGSVIPVSSHASEIDGWFEATCNMTIDYYVVAAPFPSAPRAGNSGFLGNMVLDAEILSRNKKGKNIMVYQDDAGEGSSNTVKKNNTEATNENQSNEPRKFQIPPGEIIVGDYQVEMDDHDDLYTMIDLSAPHAEENSGSDSEMT